MVQRILLNHYLARTAGMLSGARRVAMLLAVMVLTMTAQTAWAQTVVTLSEDNEIAVGTAGHYYVNMASSGTTTLTLSDASITTFKVYDDGGKNNHYAYTGNSFLKITVPIGYVIGIAGTANSEDTSYDYWDIYNGHLASEGKLFQGQYKSNPASVNVQTTGYKTAIWFQKNKSSYSNDSRNLELTVTLIPDPTYAQDISRATISEMESVFNYTGSVIPVNYSVHSYIENNLLTKGTHYTETITKDGVVTDFKEEGYYTLTITGIAPYSGSQSFNLRIKNDSPELRQDGSEWFVNMPTSGTYTPTINSNISTFKIYDDGGKGGGFNSGTPGNFTPRADGYLQIHAPSGYQVRLTGYVRTRSSNAYLTVYDGSSTSASTLCENVHGKNTGADTDTYNNVTVDVASSGEDMLLHFDAQLEGNSLDAEGLILTVSIFPPNSITVNNATGGTVAATVAGTSASTAKMNDVVTLMASPSTGYVLSGISVTDGSSNAVDIDWSIWANTATFTMPPSAVTVTPTFTNDLANLNIDMPKTGEQTATIPVGVQSFQVNYDYNITSSDASKLVMTAPSGCLLQLSGAATLTGNDQAYFRVYDGDDVVNDSKLIDSSSSGNYTGVVSTGNVMTIYCSTIHNVSKTWNLDLTVNVVSANTSSNVAISNSITNGQVVSDKNTANVNETVTLTATPAEGYVLQSISVTDGAGAISLTPSATDATWGDASYYTANEFTFKMRSSDATVNATFMAKTDFYVNMPKTDQRDFAIPDGTTSFKVYDNSGKNGRYFTNDNGKLLLTAPEGYVMNVSGYVKLYYSSGDQDYLDIYDGNSTSATSLGRFKDTSGNNNTFTQTPVTATSSTNQMLLHFVTDNSGYVDVGGGVYLTVTLKKLMTNTDITATVPNQTLEGPNSPFVNIYYKFNYVNGSYSESSVQDFITGMGVVVMDGSTPLSLGTDYQFGSVTYANGDPITTSAIDDECKVEIVGIGNYAGSRWETFQVIAPDANGTWGDNNLAWSFDGDSKTLTITGTGEMKAAASFTDYPWYGSANYIKAVTIGDGVTSIAAYAFGSNGTVTPYSNLTSVSLPSTLETIGDNAFAYSGLTSINIPVSVTNIDYAAFNQCTSLASITLNGGVTIGDAAFPTTTNTNVTVTIANSLTLHNGTEEISGDITDMTKLNGKVLTAPTYSVTANEDPAHAGEYWSTFYHPVAGYTVPSGTTAYIGTLNGSTVTLTEVTGGFIPADNAVILKGASASFNLTRAATGDAFDFTGNDLKGGSIVAAGKVPYTLAAKSGTVGFYKFTGAALNPNKAHLEIDPNSSAPGYFGFDEGTTGITNTDFTDSTDKVGAWYTLDGRKLQGMPTQKGLYIVNGKKIVIT